MVHVGSGSAISRWGVDCNTQVIQDGKMYGGMLQCTASRYWVARGRFGVIALHI